jgi:SAM-dependent methyltransferase
VATTLAPYDNPGVDPRTAAYYDAHAPDIAARYEGVASPVARFFPAAFVAGCRVLDVGAGSGRDMAALSAAGYEAFGVEPIAGLRGAAIQAHPELAGRIAAGSLPQLGDPFGGAFDGVLCSAVLMHLPESDLFDAALALRRVLRPNGRLLLSLPEARVDVGADHRDAQGRLFQPYTADYLQLLFERLGFQQIGKWVTDDALQRAGNSWFTLLLELRAGGPLRAVDQIEGVLNRDRKVATYKLALFRALAEIAGQEPRTARWLPEGRVGVPIDRIAERWLIYYWPIFASPAPVPQSHSEGAGPNNPVSFRSAMAALMTHFREQGEHGGLSTWFTAWTTARLSPEIAALQTQAMRAIVNAIKTGPVTHSGGALETGPVFEYQRDGRLVVMSADLWRELSLLGHWILDAVIVRWAALTERFALRQGITSAQVLPLLLARPAPERATALARQIYLENGAGHCVWSGRPLTQEKLVVDHVIPFTLWGNNDLWNLLPADRRVNGDKSDKLPTAELLMERKTAVLHRWAMVRDNVPAAFDLHASRLLGRTPSGPLAWQDELFGCLRQAVELTAMQRGIERWTPNGFQPPGLG